MSSEDLNIILSLMGAAKIEGDLNALNGKAAELTKKTDDTKIKTDEVLNGLEEKRSFFADAKLDNTKNVTETLLHLLEEKRDSFDKLTEAKLIEINTGVSDAKNKVIADIERIDNSINEILSRSDVSVDKILTKLQNIHDITKAKEIELTNTIEDLQTRLSNNVNNTIAREELKTELASRRMELQLTMRVGMAVQRSFSVLISTLRLFGIQLDPSLSALVHFGFTVFNQTIALASLRATEAAVQGGVNAWANWAAAMTYIQAGLMFANAMKTMYESRQIQNDIKETISFTTIYANEVNLS